MDLFEVLSMDERIIVFSTEEDGCFYTWNQSATLQCWARVDQSGNVRGDYGPDEWEECGIQSLSVEPHNYQEARDAAKRWYFGVAEFAPKQVVIDRPAKIKDTIRAFMITPERVKAIGKMVKKIRKQAKKRKKR